MLMTGGDPGLSLGEVWVAAGDEAEAGERPLHHSGGSDRYRLRNRPLEIITELAAITSTPPPPSPPQPLPQMQTLMTMMRCRRMKGMAKRGAEDRPGSSISGCQEGEGKQFWSRSSGGCRRAQCPKRAAQTTSPAVCQVDGAEEAATPGALPQEGGQREVQGGLRQSSFRSSGQRPLRGAL